MSPPPSRNYWLRLLLLALFLLLAAPVSAQETISLNETKIGQLTGSGPVSYSFVSPPGLSVHIEIIAATQGLAPQFSIFNASSALVQTIGNPSFGLVVENTLTLPQAGVYRIEVSSASGAVGQFVIQLGSGSPPVAAISLTLNAPVLNTLATNERVTYSFATSPQSGLALEIITNGTAGLTATLSDANGTVVGTMGSLLTGARFDVPPGQSLYRLELANDGSLIGLVGYRVTLVTGAPGLPISTPPPVQVITATPLPTQEQIIAPTATVTPGVSLPPLPVTGACVLATASAGAVNIRASTSTDSAIIAQMNFNAVYTVTGVNPPGDWYQVQVDTRSGWVATWVVRTGGNCLTLPVIQPPMPLPTLPPALETLIPEPEPTLSVADLTFMCANRYDNGALINVIDGNCYTCPWPYDSIWAGEQGGTVSCEAFQYTAARREGPATGLFKTDCPARSGQFFDPNGYCYSCPPGYNRTVFAVTGNQACEHGGGAPPQPTRLGAP